MNTIKPIDNDKLKRILPIAVLSAGLLGVWAIIAHRPVEPNAPPAPEPPLVSVLRAEPQTLRLDVASQGVVTPRMEIDVVPEVAGKVIRLHPDFVAGGFFAEGEALLVIDPRDYDYAITEAEARIAEARRLLALEEAQVEQAHNEWRALGDGKPTPLALHLPQLAEARAKLQAAQADLAKARLQRSRCELTAPFAGRVRDKRIGLGQYVQPGDKLARIYATDVAEIRLPLSVDQLAFLDLPMGNVDGQALAGPDVTLSAELAGGLRQWRGRIVRTEGVVDQASGLIHVIAQVQNPYAGQDGRPPLLAGLFVQAMIEGRERSDLIVLPPGAVDASQEALVVDADARLHVRKLEVLRSEPGRVLVKSGLSSGDLVVTGGIQVPVEGMKVKPADAAQPTPQRD